MRKLPFFCAIIFFLSINCAHAHFGMVIPSRSMVTSQKDAAIELEIAFAHPFAQTGMAMAAPREAFVWSGGKKEPLALQKSTYLGQPAFRSGYVVRRPGVYQFAVSPEPYFEAAEDCFIVHYAKTVVGAFGHEDGWEEPLGLPVEIIPLIRPFGNYAGNAFSAQVLRDGKPLAGATVEVEFLNTGSKYKAGNSYFETQLVRTDANGEFVFGIPWPGWWGFAALSESDNKLEHNGSMKPVEQGGVLWMQFFAPETGD